MVEAALIFKSPFGGNPHRKTTFILGVTYYYRIAYVILRAQLTPSDFQCILIYRQLQIHTIGLVIFYRKCSLTVYTVVQLIIFTQ